MKKKVTELVDGSMEFRIKAQKIDNFIEYLYDLKRNNPLHDEMFFEVINCDDFFEISIYGKRDETDEEYEYRIAREENKKELDKLNAEKSQKIRYKKYLELKKEFEGETK